MSAVGDAFLQDQLHELFGRRAHILKALTERHDCEAQAFEVLYHLNGSPAVKGDLSDIEAFTETLDGFFDIAVMNNIAFGGL